MKTRTLSYKQFNELVLRDHIQISLIISNGSVLCASMEDNEDSITIRFVDDEGQEWEFTFYDDENFHCECKPNGELIVKDGMGNNLSLNFAEVKPLNFYPKSKNKPVVIHEGQKTGGHRGLPPLRPLKSPPPPKQYNE